jgi:hypothetical protein
MKKKEAMFVFVLAVYNYEGFNRDKKNRGSRFKRHMERMGQSMLSNFSK